MARKPKAPLQVETLTHDLAARANIPTAELQSVMSAADLDPRTVRYGRNHDLDPQLMWRGKDERDWSDLVVNAPPLFIQEKIHPKVLIDDLVRQSKERKDAAAKAAMPDLFADFNGIAPDAVTEFYQHEQNWTNRMILGDSLQVMASLAEREGLRGKVQCIYVDPPYGIKFNSNFQWSTTSRDVRNGKAGHITREPEQVRAFRDTWRNGIHSYLTYLRDRLTVARDLLTDSGSVFVQIGDENVHRIRTVLDEVFGEENFAGQIVFSKTSGQTSSFLSTSIDYILWYAKSRGNAKFRKLYRKRPPIDKIDERYVCVETNEWQIIDLSVDQKSGNIPIPEGRILKLENLTSQTGSENSQFEYRYQDQKFKPGGSRGWSTHYKGMKTVEKAGYLRIQGKTLWWKSYRDQGRVTPRTTEWEDTRLNAFGDDRIYVVQTNAGVIQNCILMATDPGDLVLDPTCGSGTTATVAEQWGRRWITIDTSRVALALARARLMGARYPYYLLADSPAGRRKQAEITRAPPADTPTRGDIRLGFVYQRVPHITLKSIANNAEIDVIWDRYQQTLEPLRATLNATLGETWEEWQIPRQAGAGWPANATAAHAAWWEARIARQQAIDAAITARADQEYLHDRPYEDKSRVRVAGPFTVESLSPHHVLPIGANDELIGLDGRAAAGSRGSGMPASETATDFTRMIIENLKAAGVHQPKKDDRIVFSAVTGWPGGLIAAEGRYTEETETTAHDRRAAIFIGPEYGTVARADLIQAAREAADAGFDILIACAFNYDAHSAEIETLGRIRILKARMNPDLHMAGDLKTGGGGNMFIVFGEPDITILTEDDGRIRVKIHGVDVFRAGTGEIDSGGTDDIALWFIDTAYNEQSFFVRHAYFLGASSDPYKALKTTLKAEIDANAWASLHGDISRPFDKPATGRIAVKVINHLGDEVMKVFAV